MTAPWRSAGRALLITCVLVSLARADERVPLRVLVRSTDAAPGVTPVQTYTSVGSPRITEDGRITFGSWNGTFSGFDGSFARVFRSFQPAPDMPAGVWLANVAVPWFTPGGGVGFLAQLSGSGYENVSAVFAGPLEAPRLVARTRAPAPDIAGGAILGDISNRWFVSPPTNERGEMGCRARGELRAP